MIAFPSKIISEDISEIIKSNVQWEKLRNKTILISGANGFLPSYLIFTLLALNEAKNLNIHILGLARNREKAESKFKKYLSPKFELIIQDVSIPLSYDKTINFIVHAASQASPKYYGVDPVGTLKANTIGTSNLLDHAVRACTEKFLYFSSSEVYGTIGEEFIPTKENNFGYIDPTNVRSCYSESKRMGENMCVSWSHQFQIPISIVRPFHTYGPGMDLTDGRVYADFVSDIIHNRDIVMKSDGLAKRAFCYLTDATLGFFKVLLEGKDREAYNIGNPDQEISILNLAEKLVKLFPEKKLQVVKYETVAAGYLKSNVNRNAPDIAKAKNLGWFPKVSIENGFKRTVENYL